MRKSCRVLEVASWEMLSCFRFLPVLEYCSASWCLAADAHLKLLGVFECDIAHRRSGSVICMLYKIRCKPMYHLYGALSVPYVPVRVTRGAFGR